MFEKMKDYIGNQDLSVRRNGDEVFIICESDHEILVTAKSDLEKRNVKEHIDHDIHCACYGRDDVIVNISIECMDCYEVLYDENNPDIELK